MLLLKLALTFVVVETVRLLVKVETVISERSADKAPALAVSLEIVELDDDTLTRVLSWYSMNLNQELPAEQDR